uniref:Uncharacterized protein n=1 Tax=Cyanothece sp. (strain PCC 7425 / ATCC 29141) TaxID=395961 RepID=B8HP57_CYAP4
MYKSNLFRVPVLLSLLSGAFLPVLPSASAGSLTTAVQPLQTSQGVLIAQQDYRASQSNLMRALYSLLEAQAWLQATSTRSGGPARTQALTLTTRSIDATQQALQAGIINYGLARQNLPGANVQTNVPSDLTKLTRALEALRQARNSLNAALSDRGGYRQQALNYSLQAIQATQSSIDYAQNWYQDPDMVRALNFLRQAEKSLRTAQPNKGGHRAKAIDFVQRAIQETQWGMEYDDPNTLPGGPQPRGF